MMQKPTLTGSRSTNPAINGSGARRLTSWIDQFVDHTSNLETAEIWRKWCAITTVAAALEQRVWITTSSPLYPNLYVFLVGDAGLGKTRPIMVAKRFLAKIPDFKFGATSMTMASLVDHMAEAKRIIVQVPDPAMEYHTLTIVADELSAFMHEYDNGLIAGLTTFYDCVPYSQGRRVGDIRIKIESPQLNILSGSTVSNLLHFIPDWAWEQGFTSRCMLIFADTKPVIDVFATEFREMPKDMIHDLEVISKLTGQFGWSKEWAEAMHNWKLCGFDPQPKHPKLKHYNSRRFAHMMKLSMIAAVDRGNDLMLEKQDFNRALGWLIEAEPEMPRIFASGQGSADSKAMDEMVHFIQSKGEASEADLVRFARTRVQYSSNIPRMLEVMEQANLISVARVDKLGLKIFRA